MRAAPERFARTSPNNSSGHPWGATAFVALFLVILCGAVAAGRLPPVVLAWYFGASGMAFLTYAFDKSAARKDQWRTRESTLHALALAGGWPGALIAQKVLRHKSKKRSFQLVFWGTVVLNCGALVVYVWPSALN